MVFTTKALRRVTSGRAMSVAASAALLAGAGGVAIAATSASTTIHACYSTKTGALSRSGTGKCPSGTRAIWWNQVGPRGPAGPPGVVAGYSASNGEVGIVPASSPGGDGPWVVADTLSLPIGGDYIVNGQVNIQGGSGSGPVFMACGIFQGKAQIDDNGLMAYPGWFNPDFVTASVSGGGLVHLECLEEDTRTGFYTNTVNLTAIPVRSISS